MGDMKYNWAPKELAFTFSGTIVVLFGFVFCTDGSVGWWNRFHWPLVS